MAVINHVHLSELEDEVRFDSQYYTPENMLFEEEIKALPTICLGTVALITDGQHGYFKLDESSEIRQITAKCIKEGLVDKTNADRLSYITHNNNLRSSLAVNDVLVTTAGTIGQIGLVTEEIPPANIDQDIGRIAIKNNNVSPYFIWVFLQSKFGRFQIERFTTGQVQTHLSLKKMKKLRIPLLSNHAEVEEIVKRFLESKAAAKSLYVQAQHLLESELGLDKLTFKKPVGYTARFSELEQSRRIDAEFFQPKYQSIIELIRERPNTTLGSLFHISRGVCLNPSSYNETEGIPFIRIKELSLSQPLDPINSVKISPQYVYGKFPTAGNGDYVLAVIGATIGKINLIDELMQGSLFSNNTACLSPRSPIHYPNAMELILRSPIVQHQVQQRMAKTAQEKITDPELKRILIPCLDSALLSDLEKLCLDSKHNYFGSKSLLEQAKAHVEQLIEEAAEARRGNV